MASRGTFSNALRVTNLNDFLTPSTACILPLGGGAFPEQTNRTAQPLSTQPPPGSVLAPIIHVRAAEDATPVKAKVTVSDCLACSGCVTSADTVLLSTESMDELKRVMLGAPEQRRGRYTVVALSQQAVSSVAVHYGMGLQTTARKLSSFLREEIGFDAVLDTSFARHFSLLEAAAEFMERFKEGKKLTVASACPGWVTYAEKTQENNVLDSVSSVRSPQGMLGVIAKTLSPDSDTRDVWVCSVMPCHDKKLEAHRSEFSAKDGKGVEVRDVACVVTAGELFQLMLERNFRIEDVKEGLFNLPFPAMPTASFGVAVGSGSGGYADFVLRKAAKEVLGVELTEGPLKMEKASRSGDLQSITVFDKSGARSLRFALAYGFRSLQSVLRKIRRGECDFNYIELMACPGGCNNGGGQLEASVSSIDVGLSLKQQATRHLEAVNSVFAQAPPVSSPFDVPGVQRIYNEVVKGGPGTMQSKNVLGMSIQSRKMATNVTPAALEW